MISSKCIDLSILNVANFGDTDVFPYPLENRILFDCKASVASLLADMDKRFDDFLADYPPTNTSALTPSGYTGYRWATQIDPIWNAYFLGLVAEVGAEIEAFRPALSQNSVFSYRYKPDAVSGSLFSGEIGWLEFQQRSLSLAKQHEWVVLFDVADFYPRVYHHQIDNALRFAAVEEVTRKKILKLLQKFSNGTSYGLPIGGPAARLLAELLLAATDKFLTRDLAVPYCRFVDDFHIYAKTQQDAYKYLVASAEYLLRNEGLSLQKSKTRVMPSSEFLTSSSFFDLDKPDKQKSAFLKLSLRYDPYSVTADSDYQALKDELSKFDIGALLASELDKSRVHGPITKHLIKAIRFLDTRQQQDAVVSLLENLQVLAPVFALVMITILEVMDGQDERFKLEVNKKLRALIDQGSYLIHVDVNLAYVLRVLAKTWTEETESLFARVYRGSTNPIVRRDITLAMARWGAQYWLTGLRGSFTSMHPWERTAFLVASFCLQDQGEHWRKHNSRQWSPFEKIVVKWAENFFSLRNVSDLPL